MRKLILLMFFISISCKNDQLSEGMFSGVFTDGYNLKFINQSKKAILFLPNQIVCNEYNFNQLELDVKKIDDNAIQLNYSNKDLKSLQTVGYKEWFQFFDRKISLEKVTEEIKKNTRRYAKRQMTWFNHLSTRNLIK